MARLRATSSGIVSFTAEEEAAADAKDSLSSDNMAEMNRSLRDSLLTQSDWTQIPDSPLTDAQKTSWATYRTNLRNLPDHANWPNLSDSDWPTKP